MKRRELIAQFLPSSPFVALLGIELVEVGVDRAAVRLPFRPELTTIADVVHGGALASLIDMAAVSAAWADDAEPRSMEGATVSLTVSYVAAARGKDLTAVGVVSKRGRNLVFVDVRVTEPDDRLVATGAAVVTLGS
ncbi:PaaI family thioesterase [Solirubrobacter phytolaccae]|uniref:PaaI family thioesterase n=1 Tax=Solirubrobacter phytolaccae TaxID=1404360 RepID=A0A9X3NB54_9ACTN|nr:PaaI family thioesterase [Solirubrobacter phytolaccae]MDA0182864.1 PaaI family thioesterase [Solirubrobacter phytolaccae]